MSGPMMRRIVCLVVTALIAATLAIVPATTGRAAGTVTVTATSTAPGTDAQALAGGHRGLVWRSAGTARGVALTARLPAPTSVDGMRIAGAGPALRIRDARLEFSDGSVIMTRTNPDGDRTIAFPARIVRWVRLVVVPGAAGSVGLAGWTLHRGRSTATASAGVLRPAEFRASSGDPTASGWTAGIAGTGQWVRARLQKPVVVAAVRVAGGSADAADAVRTASLRFSDGSRVPIGTLEPGGGSPTTVAFTPRLTKSVTLVVTDIAAGRHASVKSIEIYPAGVTPQDPSSTTPTYRDRWQRSASCGGVRVSSATATLRLLCPTNGREADGRVLRATVSGPAGAALHATAFVPDGGGGTVRVVARSRIGADGTGRLSVVLRRLLHGPTAVRISAAGVSTPLYLQIVNAGGVAQRAKPSAAARGLSLVYADDFDGRLSATRTGAGAVYASGKPNSYGVDDFGEAIFAQPSSSQLSTSTMPGGYLRIPARALGSGETDPAPYGRRSAGGLISSAHMGGSGFSAQYGYFEARMLAPGGAGTWPAFWLLSTGSLVGGGSTAEFDAVELYGVQPLDVYQTSHGWGDPAYSVKTPVYTRLPADRDTALVWHTYGARVTPTGVDYFIDGIKAGHNPRTLDQDQPFFFLANLALTGDWRTGLAGTSHRADLYIDSIRVWV